MRCQDTEPRLNQLLDNDQAVASDTELSAHLLCCSGCAALADAYGTFALWSDDGREVVELPHDLAARVVAAQQAPPLRVARWQWTHYAVAAAVLLTATTALQLGTGPGLTNTSAPTTAAVIKSIDTQRLLADAASQIDRPVWRVTGRTLATMPLGVVGRGLASLSDTPPASRERVREAVEAIRDAWTESPVGTQPMPNGKTGAVDEPCLLVFA